MLIETTLKQPFRRESWTTLISDLFENAALDLFTTPTALEASAAQVISVEQLGSIALDEGNVALLVIETSSQVQLAQNRVALRNFIAKLIQPGLSDAVLAVFHQPDCDDWRITYAAKRNIFDETTYALTEQQTAPKRFTFLVGPGEPCKTASERLKKIQLKGESLTLDHIEDAFSVEKLSKEFFTKYNLHYDAFLAELLSPERITDTRQRFKIKEEASEEAQSKADKPIRDFTKKLLGRLIFLAFLQKKGWLHVTARKTDWSSGDRNFLQTYFLLAQSQENATSFHSRYLAPLFFEALNTERPDDLFTLTLPNGKLFSSRMPYLNGGLFDPEPEQLQTLDFPTQLFENLFNFFGEYNFTIDENDPEDHEVGIDPEMLGHIFENLLEDNKDKGAYYTPKVIVAYMCRQSLLHYLESHLGKHDELTRLVELHEPGDLTARDSWCASQAKKIATLLKKVKICDPAIGSGAFPIGMLNEIVHLRTLLNAELNDPAERAKLKKSIIQKSIYGVDLDFGAVDIARLRFWLTLVVDEASPSPLPNLDYKIMQGNSLIESFHGVDLSQLHEPASQTPLNTPLGLDQSELDIFTNAQLEIREDQQATHQELLEARRAYFAARKPERKAELRAIIDEKIIEHIRHYLESTLDEEQTKQHRIETEWGNKRVQAPKWDPAKAAQKRYDTLLIHIKTLQYSLTQLEQLQQQSERPFFLWHLLFPDVFKDGGFDIVIANPPYVRQELIKEQKPLLLAEGYTTYTGTADLLVYFYERASQLLKPSGVLTFITSNKFYRADYGQKVRTYLSEKLTLHTIIDFGEAPIFNGVAVDATVLIGQNETAPHEHNVSALPWDLQKPAAALPQEIAHMFPVAQDSLTPDGWRFVSPAVQSLLEKIRSIGTPLGEYVEGRFYYGIKTGFNEAFVIDGSKRAELIAADPNSEKIIKPFLRGRDVKRWQAKHADLWLIKIESSANTTHPWTNAEKPEEVLKKTYPAVYKWLDSHRDRLIKRDDQGIYFWELRSCAYWQEFKQPKIGYADIGKTLKAFFAREEIYFANTLYFIPRVLPELHALLMTSTIEYIWRYCFQCLGDAFDGGRTRFFSESMQHLPIPPATTADKAKLATLAEKCAEATANNDAATLASHEHEINQITYRLFNLTESEITLIETTLGIEQAAPFGTAINYLREFLPRVFKVAGEAITFSQLFDAYHLICKHAEIEQVAIEAIGSDARPWLQNFAQPTDLNEFTAAFRELLASEDLEITGTGHLRWISPHYGATSNHLVDTDAQNVSKILLAAPEKLPQPTELVKNTILQPIRQELKLA